MATVLHIDGPPITLRHFEIQPGESFREVADRLSVTIREERVPDPPRKLDPQAAEFIRSYEREDPQSVLAVYWRYHSLDAEEFDSVEGARRFLENGREWGELAGEAIVDGDRIEVLP